LQVNWNIYEGLGNPIVNAVIYGAHVYDTDVYTYNFRYTIALVHFLLNTV